jgi:hypothetical protein
MVDNSKNPIRGMNPNERLEQILRTSTSSAFDAFVGPKAQAISAFDAPSAAPVRIDDHELNPAKWAYERIVKQIDEFEKELSDEEEIGGRLISAPGEGAFHIEDVSYWGPDKLIFSGKNQHGKPVRLLQHNSQFNILLTALPKDKDEPRRIGFMLEQKLKKQDESTD